MKTLLTIVCILFSLNGFCCKPSSQMAGESFFVNGILNKLKSESRFSEFEISNITKIDFNYSVILNDTQNQKCLELILKVYGTGSCHDFTADILNENIKECAL